MAKDLWTYLQGTDKTILMYGMGNGADKILAICERYNISIADFFASDTFVRGHFFHGKRVLTYSEAVEKYGKENIIVLLSFATSLPDVLDNIYRIAFECELYAPDVPVCGDTLFNSELFEKNKIDVAFIESILADEESKRIYRRVIDYKLSGDVKLLKDSFSDFSIVYKNVLKSESFCDIADLGAYNGDTIRELADFSPFLRSALAFEPDRRNFKKLCEYAESEDRFEINAVPFAAWDKKETLQFDASGNRNSSLMSGARIETEKQPKIIDVCADSLDNVLDGRRVDYIKYDVEGSEYEAILGSFETIKKSSPALMISLYHRSEDIFRLPLLIHKAFPEYKLYIRRREYVPAWDTVLLAVKQTV